MKENLYGKLSKGCELCLGGLVLPVYTSFLCNKSCYYCPIIKRVDGKNITMLANKKIGSLKELSDYIPLAQGMSISGGEPLLVFDRTLKIIKFAKNEAGEKFHVHMYTNGELLTKGKMKQLAEAGLDEIRIHNFDLNIFSKTLDFGVKVGSEIPCVPGEEKKFVDFICSLDEKGVEFININELQSADQSISKIRKKGFKVSGNKVIGSEETALNIVKTIRQKGLKIPVHYCSIKQEINNAKKRIKQIGM